MDAERVDLSELARNMLIWEQLRGQLEEIENRIRTAVLALGKTQTVGTVRASYSAGRKTYDYKAAAEGHPMVGPVTIGLFTVTSIDWKGVCGHVGIDDIPYKESPPSVSVKIVA